MKLVLFLLLPVMAWGQADNPQDGDNKDEEPWWESAISLPNLISGDIGELPEEAETETRTWDHALPFMAQQVIDLGFELPNPYGAGLVGVNVEQELLLSELEVGLNGSELRPVDFVSFGKSTAENGAGQIKLDAWLLPFMNVYMVLGKLDGDAVIPLAVPGGEAIKFLFPELGSICDRPPGFPGRPDACDEIFSGTAFPHYDGTNVGIGITLAMGWRRYFFVLPITYVKTDLDIVASKIDTLNISPRLGITIETENYGMFALFAGGSYMDVDLVLTGQVQLAPPDDPDFEPITIDFRLRQKNKDHWNTVVGFNWDITPNLSVMGEVGFGSTREHLIGSTVYRW